VVVLAVAFLASFGDRQWRGKERSFVPDFAWEHGVEAGVGLKSLQFFDCALHGALKADVITGQAVKLGIEHIDGGLEDADAAEVPGGGDKLVKEGLLESALGIDFGLVTGLEFIEGFEVFRFDEQLLGSEAVFEGVLRAASFAFFSARAGAELRVGAVGLGAHGIERSFRNHYSGRGVEFEPWFL
jgi:hypothetical protein